MLIKESVFATLSKLYIVYLHLLKKNHHDHSAARAELATKVKERAGKNVKETAASVAAVPVKTAQAVVAVPAKVVKTAKKVVKVKGDGKLDGRVEAVREVAVEAGERIRDATLRKERRFVTPNPGGWDGVGTNGLQVEDGSLGEVVYSVVKEMGGDVRDSIWNREEGIRKVRNGVVVRIEDLFLDSQSA
jgi:hypothetical protein